MFAASHHICDYLSFPAQVFDCLLLSCYCLILSAALGQYQLYILASMIILYTLFTICLQSGTICDYLLSCSTISNDHIFSVMICYCQLCSPNMCECAWLFIIICYYFLLPADFLALSATLCYYLQLPYVSHYGVLLYPIIWCVLLSSPTLLVSPAIIYDHLHCGLLSATVGYDL